MASMPPATRPEDDESITATGSAVDEQTVNVQVLSPSVGVTRPLLFPSLAASTTVKQLKHKIRQTLPLRPADENQRLIHRGRAIVRESDTLLDIFGADAVRNPEQQTIHLVIRDVHDSQSSASTAPSAPSSLPAPAPAPAPGPSPTASAPPTNPPRAQPQHPQGHAFGYQMPWRNSMPPTSNPFPQPRMPSPSPSHTPEQVAAFQHHHQNMTQWLNNIQREAMTRAINQNQRTRAQMGMRGVGDNGLGTVPAGDGSGRASPAPGQTTYREHVGPNGHTYQVETVVRTGGGGQQGTGAAAVSMSPADVHNIIRSADINQATSAAASAMQRSASSTSIHNRPFAQPGVSAPAYPHGHSIMSSRRGTPEPASTRLVPTAASGSSQSRQGPEVYVLSSPEGPRALLFNNSSSEAYYTPRLRTQTSLTQLRQSMLASPQDGIAHLRQRPHHHHHHHPRSYLTPNYAGQFQPQGPVLHHPHPQPLPQQQVPQQEPVLQAQPQPQGQGQAQNQGQEPEPGAFMGPLMHRGNPPMAALPPLLMQLWPQIWLLFRLALFVWFFTSPDASWSRWLTIIVIAVFIFVLSTGVFNGVPDHVWRPLGRHLENLIPLDPGAQQGVAAPEQRNQQNQQNPQPRQDPDPTEMARRLVAQHQGPDNWILSQVRRLERAGLLFLASIAPGVAERHIANLEAAARAERERIEAEAREAEAAAAAAQNDENNENPDENEGERTTTGTETDQAQGVSEDHERLRAEQGAQEDNQHGEEREPLIQL